MDEGRRIQIKIRELKMEGIYLVVVVIIIFLIVFRKYFCSNKKYEAQK
jgi:hypothetical protein